MADQDTPRPVADLSYEQARDELVAIVAQLESGQQPLEQSLRMWERGEALAAHCATWLDRAEARLAGEASPVAASPAQGAPTHGPEDAEAPDPADG